MPTSRRRTSTSVSVSKQAIDQVSSSLVELPEKPKRAWSLREAIAQLQEPITAALARGYSYEEVTNILADNGVEIAATSLKRYLSMSKSQASATKSKPQGSGKKRGRKSSVAASEDGNVASSTNGASASELSAAEALSAEVAESPVKSTSTRRRARASSAAKSKTRRAATGKTTVEASTPSTTGAKTSSRTSATRRRKKTNG